MIDDTVFDIAAASWGAHPSDWPTPPREMPRWWHFQARMVLEDLEEVFGDLTQDNLDAFWAEIREGQGFDDAGGYILRCYKAMMGCKDAN